jgi:hypothetical protein
MRTLKKTAVNKFIYVKYIFSMYLNNKFIYQR